MERIETIHPDVFVIEPRVWTDERGWFLESFHADKYRALGISGNFVQDNHSCSRKSVLRGLHFQIQHPQAKIVQVISGEIVDVVVDIRRGSPYYGTYATAHLTADNHRQIYVPRGFAHGFIALNDNVQVLYKCDDIYHAGDESGILWNDPDIGIPWKELGLGDEEPILSAKDRILPRLAETDPAILPLWNG